MTSEALLKRDEVQYRISILNSNCVAFMVYSVCANAQ